jgi:hypothetical protein
MRKIKLFPVLITAAVIALGSITVPTIGFAEVNIQINGYLPAPSGVRVYESIWKKTVDIIMIIAVTDRSIRITETMVTTMATTMATIMVTADSTITTD